jgi:uncharacterized protein (TIGR03437 family)
MNVKLSIGVALIALGGWQRCESASSLTLSADGLTVYDTADGITWLADANLASGNRFGLPVCAGASRTQPCVNASGSMNYPSAVAWVAAMNAARYLGRSDWQLPTTPPLDAGCGKKGASGNSFGFGCTASAFGTLYNALGLKAPDTAVPIAGNSVGPFRNFQPYIYWSQSSAGGNGQSTFSFNNGFNGANTGPNFEYVLPMIPGKIPGMPSASGNGLQVNPGGETVYDPVADVTWLANANLAQSNTFGLPLCTDPVTPALCVARDGAMTADSAAKFIANMNAYDGSGYLGQKNWQLPPVDPNCGTYNCKSAANPMGELFYGQLGLSEGTPVAEAPDTPAGPFRHLQPYWACNAATIQSPCEAQGPNPSQEWSFSFGSGFEGTDLLQNELYVTAYFVGSRASGGGPAISAVANAEGGSSTIAPNTWVAIQGANLAPAGDSRIWQASDFAGGNLPAQLDGVSVTVNGKPAYVYYISPAQVNILTPPDAMSGAVGVVVTNNGAASAGYVTQAATLSPSLFVFSDGRHVAAVHLDGSLLGPGSMSAPGYTFTPASPGETVLLFANGFGATNTAVAAGSATQSGTLAPLPQIKVGGIPAAVTFAGLVSPGLFQFNVTIPPSAPTGDQPITAAYNGATTQAGTLIAIAGPATANGNP